MIKNVIQLPRTKEINSSVERFNESLDFLDFLELLDLVLDGKLLSSIASEALNNAINKGMRPFSKWDSLFQRLAKVDFTPLIASQRNSATESVGAIAADDSDSASANQAMGKANDEPNRLWTAAQFDEALAKIVASSKEIEQQHAQLLNDSSNFYYLFYPALEVKDAIEEEFGSNNPGRVIGSYLRAFFESIQPNEDYRLPFVGTCDQDLWALLLEIFKWKLENAKQAEQSDQKTQLDSPSQAIKFFDLDSLCLGLWFGLHKTETPDTYLLQILADAPTLSQSLFESLIWHWLFLFEESYIESTTIDLLIMQLPIGYSYPKTDLPKELYGFNEKGESNVEKMATFWGVSDDMGLRNIPYIPWPILFKLIEKRPLISTHVSDDSEETKENASAWSFRHSCDNKINWDVGRYRRLFGRSPLCADDLQRVVGYDQNNADLIVLLSHSASCFLSYPFGLSFVRDGQNRDKDMRNRADYYWELIGQAKEEGFTELASNLLSFFLFSQAGFSGKLHIPFNELSPVVEQLLYAPGKEILRHALICASEMTHESGDLLTTLVLDSLVGQRQADIRLIEPVKRRPRLEPIDIGRQVIRNELFEDLGEERVKNFSKEAFDSLIDAELQWSKLSREFGRGLKDCGAIGLGFVKPIEIELERRIGSSYKSKSCSDFLMARGTPPVGKITLGPLLNMLKDFDQLPADVQQSIRNNGVRLQENAVLVRDLISIVLPLRNKAAHSEPFSGKDFSKLRSTLFLDGRLKMFLDLLS